MAGAAGELCGRGTPAAEASHAASRIAPTKYLAARAGVMRVAFRVRSPGYAPLSDGWYYGVTVAGNGKCPDRLPTGTRQVPDLRGTRRRQRQRRIEKLRTHEREISCSCGKICRAPCFSPGPSAFSPFVSAIAVIPARYESSRLPGKALADIAGTSMIEHVYRRTAAARSISAVIVATDDERIHRAVQAFGGESRMTSAAHQSGTDRIAEIVRALTCSLVVNVQGDEPLIEPAMIDEAVAPFADDASLMMSTLRRRIDDDADRINPNVTKVVVDRHDFALYFSRAALPFTREGGTPAPGVAPRRPVRVSPGMPAAPGGAAADRNGTRGGS